MTKNAVWSSSYAELVNRHEGLLNQRQQETLRTSRVAVLGMGGLGGTCFEILVRSGIGAFHIIDRDVFESSNLNRQIFAFRGTVGEKKTAVAERFARDISPDIEIRPFDTVTAENIDAVLEGVDVIVQCIDDLPLCVLVARQARRRSIPLVEGWALPYGNVRVFDESTVDLEEAYGLDTKGRNLDAISETEWRRAGMTLFENLGRTGNIRQFYSDDAAELIQSGRIPSFAPMAWMTSCMMATEAIKILLGWGEIARAPGFTYYDPYTNTALKT